MSKLEAWRSHTHDYGVSLEEEEAISESCKCSGEWKCKEGYESLVDVLRMAYEQAANGKGNERHANGLPFDDQPMQVISELLDTPFGMAFQAIKKVQEGLRLPTKERQIAEILGAINYLSGIVVYLNKND